ncbi:MAG TPA: signal peptide peptidase SppA [Phycisphaerae bacterium]|nr:signal peptide peptidase SppA [Phycisphaerae bacterium]HOJ75624.1 signal peptide peptidase SppA [Phycisphaerae bacterium]HOM52492.1 signal peptide peptidase SppA [Phycisphaerae bacterium]HON65365.1 signal peptide peptidase SppA [Phycisphaerae bacterium]HOQ85334.1 signal peptide peptidase SppA [Phycisphaerae bacterium]
MRHVRRAGIIIIGIGFVFASTGWTAPAVNETEVVNKVAVFRLSGELPEAPAQFSLFKIDQINFYELLNRLNKAKRDPKVKAVILLFDEPQIGWAQRQEIRQTLLGLKAADKDVFALLEDEEQPTYLMATAASKLYIVPTGGVNLIGLHLEQAYLKGLLDKIGVTADIEHVGSYKGAGEPFTRTGPSEEALEMTNWLVNDLFDQMVQQIAEDRKLSPERVRELIDQGPFTAEKAKAAGLVDEVAYPEDLMKTLKERYGTLELVHNYGQRELPDVDLSSPFGIFKFFGEMMAKTKAGTRPQIAVVYVDGMIVPGKTEDDLFGGEGLVGSTTLRRLLARVRKDDQVKAVVLRVNSPGGSAVASDIIWHATQALGDKPFIVSMGNVAASGGYYVSAGAAKIFADPGTITGSIGVVGGKLVTQGLWDWVGVNFHETTRGKRADLFSTSRPFTDEQREIVRTYMRDVYQAFKDRVAEGRKDKLKGDLEALAGGRVYTGRQAQAKGLVDQLGGLQDAIKAAASEANISNYEVVQLPEPKNFVELFIKSLSGEDLDEEGDSVQVMHRGWLTRTPAAAELLRTLAKADPVRMRAVLSLLQRLELLSTENALLVMPDAMIVR